MWDEDARRFADFAVQFSERLGGSDGDSMRAAGTAIQAALSTKSPGQVDPLPALDPMTLPLPQILILCKEGFSLLSEVETRFLVGIGYSQNQLHQKHW